MTPPTARAPSDAAMDRIKAALPVGWTLTIDDTQLTVRRTETLWSLYGNRINAPASNETPAAQAERIMKHGKEIYAEFIYRLEPRWADDRLAEARRANEATRIAIAELPKKHDIEKLRSKFAKDGDTYVGKTDAENQRIAAYETERGELHAELQVLPDCHTDRHSLFAESQSGLADEFHLVHPDEAGQEVYAVLQKVKETCGGR